MILLTDANAALTENAKVVIPVEERIFFLHG
jgi:hypothetical protein